MNNRAKRMMVNPRNLFFILAVSRLTNVIIFMPVITAGWAFEDAWASVIVAYVLVVPIVLLLSWVSVQSGEEGLLTRARKRWGWWSAVFLAPYVLLFAIIPGYGSAQLGVLFTTVALTQTPAGMIIALTLFVGAYAAYNGIDTIGRVAQIVFTLLVALAAATMLGVWTEIDTGRLLPHFSRGFSPIVGSAWVPAAWTIVSLSPLPVLAGEVQRARDGVRWAALAAATVDSAVLIAFSSLAIMVFSAQEAHQMLSPAYSLAKLIRVPHTFERLEVVVLTAWISAISIDAGVFLYTASQALSELTRAKSHRPFILPVAITAALCASYLFSSVTIVRHSTFHVLLPVVAVAAVAIPFLATLILRGPEEEAQNEKPG
jgi:spore germination protein KB